MAYGPVFSTVSKVNFSSSGKKGKKVGFPSSLLHLSCQPCPLLLVSTPPTLSLLQPSTNPGPPRGDQYNLWNKLDKYFHSGLEGSRKQNDHWGVRNPIMILMVRLNATNWKICLSATVPLMPRHPPNGHFSFFSDLGTLKRQPEEMTARGTDQV